MEPGCASSNRKSPAATLNTFKSSIHSNTTPIGKTHEPACDATTLNWRQGCFSSQMKINHDHHEDGVLWGGRHTCMDGVDGGSIMRSAGQWAALSSWPLWVETQVQEVTPDDHWGGGGGGGTCTQWLHPGSPPKQQDLLCFNLYVASRKSASRVLTVKMQPFSTYAFGVSLVNLRICWRKCWFVRNLSWPYPLSTFRCCSDDLEWYPLHFHGNSLGNSVNIYPPWPAIHSSPSIFTPMLTL